jgi:hypothetical protein
MTGLDCMAEPNFLFAVFFHLLPTLVLWFGFGYLLRFASDWF